MPLETQNRSLQSFTMLLRFPHHHFSIAGDVYMSPCKNNLCSFSVMSNRDIANMRQKVFDAVTCQLLFTISVHVDIHTVYLSRGIFFCSIYNQITDLRYLFQTMLTNVLLLWEKRTELCVSVGKKKKKSFRSSTCFFLFRVSKVTVISISKQQGYQSNLLYYDHFCI